VATLLKEEKVTIDEDLKINFAVHTMAKEEIFEKEFERKLQENRKMQKPEIEKN